MCILAGPPCHSSGPVAPVSCLTRPPSTTSDGTLALSSAYIHPHNFVPFVEERNDDQHHRRVATQGCTSRGILLPAHLRDRGRGELWYQRAADGRRRSSADCPQHLGARAALPYRDRQQPDLRGGAVGPA